MIYIRYNSNAVPEIMGLTKDELELLVGSTPKGKKPKTKDSASIIITDSKLLDSYLFQFLTDPPNVNLKESLCLQCFKSLWGNLLGDLKYDKADHCC